VRAWNRSSAVLLVALALILVLKTRRLLGEDRGTETQIFDAVSAQLAGKERFQNLAIEVDRRTVRLRGTVPVLEDQRQAIQRAADTKDVRIVVSHIRVATERIPDALLLEQLRERLAADHENQIKLKVKKGVVTMQGPVQHDAHREKILSTVASFAGVVGMKDKLQVVAN